MKKFHKELSFTLVELLVSIFIIILIAGVVFANYRQSGQQFALQRSANKLAQDIRRAQAMAMGAKEYQGSVPPRYGVEFTTANPDYYILFADNNDNGTYQSNPDVEVEKIPLEEGVRIVELFTSSPQTGLWITFKSPDPITDIRDPGDPRSLGGIRLIGANSQTKTISVNSAGLIEIE